MKSGNRQMLHRITFIEEEIRNGSYPNSTWLAQEQGVSERTIRRDIQFLKECGAPIEFDYAKNGYYFTERSFQLSYHQMTEGELIAVFVARQISDSLQGTPFEKPFQQALDRLSEFLSDSISVNLQELTNMLSVTPSVITEQDVSVFAILSEGLRTRQSVEMRYWSAHRNEESVRLIDPWHITHLEKTWYVIGFCHTRQEPLMFAVHRVKEANVTNNCFALPEDFNISEYLGDSFRGVRGEGKSQKIHLRFRPDIAGRIQERIWHQNQELTILEDGSLEMHLSVSDFADLKRWILWWGSDCEILEPDQLREELISEIQSMSKIYENEN